MEIFFLCCSKFDEIETIDLLLRRYGNIEYVLSLKIADFSRLLDYAYKDMAEEKIRAEWLELLPHMSMGILKYMSLDEYIDKRTGRNIDMRPDSVIIAEIEALHSQSRKEN